MSSTSIIVLHRYFSSAQHGVRIPVPCDTVLFCELGTRSVSHWELLSTAMWSAMGGAEYIAMNKWDTILAFVEHERQRAHTNKTACSSDGQEGTSCLSPCVTPLTESSSQPLPITGSQLIKTRPSPCTVAREAVVGLQTRDK